MTNQHRATPEQWASVEEWAIEAKFSSAACLLELRARVEALEKAQRPSGSETRSFRIDTSKWSDEQRQQFLGEINEPSTVERFTDPRLGEPWAAQVDGIQHGPAAPAAGSSADLISAASLVERVASILDPDDPICARGTARAAIREVAAWLEQRCQKADDEEPSHWDPPSADDAIRWLRDEANR